MRYSFTKDEMGWQRLTVAKPTPSDKGLTPTEAENILNQLQENIFGKKIQSQYKLKIEISPKLPRKLDDTVVDFIKKQEERYTKKDSANKLNRYDYYVLTLRALQKLRYVDDSGKTISPPVFSTALRLRRPTLWKHDKNIDSEKYSTEYLDIERALFFRSE